MTEERGRERGKVVTLAAEDVGDAKSSGMDFQSLQPLVQKGAVVQLEEPVGRCYLDSIPQVIADMDMMRARPA